jgi:hypothetical protein
MDRLERILTMVYVVQRYWACFGLYPSSYIHLWTETDPVYETLWGFLSSTYKTMDKVQNEPNILNGASKAAP